MRYQRRVYNCYLSLGPKRYRQERTFFTPYLSEPYLLGPYLWFVMWTFVDPRLNQNPTQR